jgi:hypothetical protein
MDNVNKENDKIQKPKIPNDIKTITQTEKDITIYQRYNWYDVLEIQSEK